MRQEELGHLSTDRLAELCAEQTRLFEKGAASDSRFCYELIRRAVFGIEGAWKAVDAQYRPWLRRKVARHYQGNQADVEDLVQESLIRFHKYVTPESWSKFPDLARLLAFLGTCARNLTLNHLRDMRKLYRREQTLPQDKESSSPFGNNLERQIETDREYRQWQTRVQACVSQKCKDPRDLLLAELRWVYDLRPSEIHAQHPDEFPSIPEVYKLVRNLKDRISRDADCTQLLEEMP